jgi:probable F420-dependent oxidoreductase
MEGMMYPVPFCDPDGLVKIACEAERLGFDSIGGNDHIVAQEYVKKSWDLLPRYYETFGTFAYIAGKTEEIRLNTAVTVLPFRDTVWVAKQAATLDVLSKGRLLFGVGIGAYREEFESVRPNENASRGEIMDESMEALSQLLKGPAAYKGKYVEFEEIDLHPRPVQNPFPIYVGGNHSNAISRAVKWGNGWLPFALTPNEIKERSTQIKAFCEEEKRNPKEIDVAPQLVCCIDRDSDTAKKNFESSQVFEHMRSLIQSTLKDQEFDALMDVTLVGDPTEIIEKIDRYHEVGVNHFPAIMFAANDVEELVLNLKVFSETVLPSF